MFKVYSLVRFDMLHSCETITAIKIIYTSIALKRNSPYYLFPFITLQPWIRQLLSVTIDYFMFPRILYKWNHIVSYCYYFLVSLPETYSMLLHSFLHWVKFHCVDISQFVYPFSYWWIFMLFPIFSYYKQGAVNICVYILLWKDPFTFLGLVPGRRTVGLYVRFMFNFNFLIFFLFI